MSSFLSADFAISDRVLGYTNALVQRKSALFEFK